MLIRRAHVWGQGPADVRLAGGIITAAGPGLRAGPGEDELDARGGLLLPGLHDHHVHLRALAAARASVPAGPPLVRTARDLEARLRQADQDLTPGAWLRAAGYHESVAGPLDRWALDRIVPGRPVRIQHRTGALWMLNSAAAGALALEGSKEAGVERDGTGQPTGRLWRLDRWLATRLGASEPDLAAVSRQAAAWGVTGFTDATPSQDRAVPPGLVRQRLHSLGRTKILLDDDTLPTLDELAGQIRNVHAAGRPVAVHCVTRVQLLLTLAALDAAGRHAGDRIEHAAVVPGEVIGRLRGLTVVTQPQFVTERAAQYRAEVSPDDRPGLWRLGSLLRAGVTVAAGSDAPFGSADPWAVVRAAVRRPGDLGPDEAVGAERAIGLFLGGPETPAVPRTVTAGQPADLVLLRVPPDEALRKLSAELVRATFVGGEPVTPASWL